MSNQLSNAVLGQLFAQESDDPFLILVTLTHANFSPIYLVNNSENVVSNGKTFQAFPMRIVLPTDDGESNRQVSIDFDNVDRSLISLIRSITDTQIDVKLELVLASIPDQIQMSFEELKIQTISYNATRISARLFMDSFLNTEISSEKYTPSNYPGIF